MNIILGSQSPRRRELMRGLDIPFTAVTIDADESYPKELQGGDIPLYISRAKARAYTSKLTEEDLLITSDTIVWLDGEMLGKPHSEAEAKQMLGRLSGHTHQVFTAVCFTRLDTAAGDSAAPKYIQDTLVDSSDVTFRELTGEEIDYYVEHYRPMDKAGSYAIQEWIGYVGITRIEGSQYTVMGFPIEQVYMYLKSKKYCDIVM